MAPRIHTIGLDIAKEVFQVHGADSEGKAVLKRTLRRSEVTEFFQKLPPCLIGMEACGTAHHWGRAVRAFGHEVKLIPPQYVKPYVKRQKNDAVDAEAICEAVRRPGMRFVPIKSKTQQATAMLHRARRAFTTQRFALTNALRAHLAEFGIVRPKGKRGRSELLEFVDELPAREIPKHARTVLRWLAQELRAARAREGEAEAHIIRAHEGDPRSVRLATIPGVGPITASAIVAAVGDARRFKSGRNFAAWIGLVPKQKSSGGRTRLGQITRRGNSYLRTLLFMCATSAMRAGRDVDCVRWAMRLRKRKSYRVTAVALANKIARIAWSLLAKRQTFCAQLSR